MKNKKTSKTPAPVNPMFKQKLSHNSLYFKHEFPAMYVPVPLRTAITFRLFWWNKISINVRASVKTVIELIKTKLKKAKPVKADAVIDGNDIKTGKIKSDGN